MVLKVLQAQFTQGALVGGSVRQSIAVDEGGETPQFGGVYRVSGIALSEYGIIVDTPQGKSLVPWHLIASCKVTTDDPVPMADPPLVATEVESDLPSPTTYRAQRQKLPTRG